MVFYDEGKEVFLQKMWLLQGASKIFEEQKDDFGSAEGESEVGEA